MLFKLYLIFNPQERYRNFFQCCLFTILLTARLRLDSNWKTGLKQEDSLNVYFSFFPLLIELHEEVFNLIFSLFSHFFGEYDLLILS